MTSQRSVGPSGRGGPPRSFGPIAKMVEGGGGDLTDRELRERAVVLLKETLLFRHMSWRLLSDLVTFEDLQVVHDAIDRTHLDFAVLVVLEGTVIVSRSSEDHSPVDSPVRPGPVKLVELAPCVYFRNDPKFAPFALSDRSIEAPRKQALRYYALLSETLNHVPTQVLAAMDPDAVGGNLGVLL